MDVFWGELDCLLTGLIGSVRGPNTKLSSLSSSFTDTTTVRADRCTAARPGKRRQEGRKETAARPWKPET